MIELERQLIGACLNTPSAALAATGVLPEYFSEPYLADIWTRMREAAGKFTLATIVADMTGHQHFEAMGGKSYLADLYTGVTYTAEAVEPTAAKLIDAYKRRQAQLYLEHQHNLINRGDPVEAVVAEFKAKFEALSNIGSKSTRFKPVAIADLAVPVTPWLIKGVMPTKGVGFTAGASGAAKTFLCLDMALGLASGIGKVLDRKAKRCGVIYIAAEDFEGCKGRVAAWRIEHKQPENLPFEMIGGGVNLLDLSCVDDLCRALSDAASRFADAGVRLGLVVVDTMARCLPGADENSAEHMSLAVGALEAMAVCSGAFVMAVAHHGKSGTSGGIRGWSGMNAASDMTLTVERDENDPELRVMTCSKVKNGRDGLQLAFRLRTIGLGVYDEDGDELDSCVCAYEPLQDREVQVRQAKLPAQAEIALKAVKYAHDHFTTYPVPAGMPRVAWSKAVEFMAVKNWALKNGFAQSRTPAETHTRFSSALEHLVSRDRIRMDSDSDLIWLI